MSAARTASEVAAASEAVQADASSAAQKVGVLGLKR
jgi:hypothetical protein